MPAASAAASMTTPPAASTRVKRSAGRTNARGTNRSESFQVGRTTGGGRSAMRTAHGSPPAPVLGARATMPDPEPADAHAPTGTFLGTGAPETAERCADAAE